jgi:hypothetical protein
MPITRITISFHGTPITRITISFTGRRLRGSQQVSHLNTIAAPTQHRVRKEWQDGMPSLARILFAKALAFYGELGASRTTTTRPGFVTREIRVP